MATHLHFPKQGGIKGFPLLSLTSHEWAFEIFLEIFRNSYWAKPINSNSRTIKFLYYVHYQAGLRAVCDLWFNYGVLLAS